jgi:hypothetical protein
MQLVGSRPCKINSLVWASMLCDNLRGTLHQAAMVMQLLRSDMNDVHGAKPALEPVVYDALKLAPVLVSFMR